MPMSFSSFLKCKPFYVKTVKDRHTCCCRYHVQARYAAEDYSRQAKEWHKGCRCECPNCWVLDQTPIAACPECGIEGGTGFRLERCVHTEAAEANMGHAAKGVLSFGESVTEWVEAMLCPVPEGKQCRDVVCVKGECENCGWEKKIAPLLCEWQDGVEETASWREYQYVEQSKGGKKVELVTVKDVKTAGVEGAGPGKRPATRADLVRAVRATMEGFVLHDHVAQWQDDQLKSVAKKLPSDRLMLNADFAENFNFQPKVEIQSQYFANKQLSILVVIIKRHGSLRRFGRSRQLARRPRQPGGAPRLCQ